MRKLWNVPDWPVWSVSTRDAAGRGNMNIATYLTPVSMEPKLITLGVYHGTKTRASLSLGATCVVQLLGEVQASLVPLLGKESGLKTDKIARLVRRGVALAETKEGFYYLPEALGYMVLEITSVLEVEGDHTLMTGRVLRSKQGSTGSVLTTGYLRRGGYIR